VRVVYIDSLFFINLIANDLLLLSVRKICAIEVRKSRLLFSAFLGSVYSCFTILPGMDFLHHISIKLAVGVLMLLCAFGGQKGFLRITLVFLAVSAAFAGIVMAVALLGGEIWTGAGIYLPVSLRALLLSFGFSYALMSVVFKFMAARRGKGGYAKVTIAHGSSEVAFTALKDTGNNVRDWVTGLSVPIVDPNCLRGLFSRDTMEIITNTNGMAAAEKLELLWEKCPGLRFRLIPYSAIGVKNDLLLAFKPDQITINGKRFKGMWAAISPTKISENGVFSALISGDI
jgi:stage II sporulation protein GA (sporulation sigma-E factor processing peptidase)